MLQIAQNILDYDEDHKRMDSEENDATKVQQTFDILNEKHDFQVFSNQIPWFVSKENHSNFRVTQKSLLYHPIYVAVD